MTMSPDCGSFTEVCISENTCTVPINVIALNVENFCGGSVAASAIWQFVPNANCEGEIRSGVVSGAMDGFTSEAFGPGIYTITFEVIDACGNTANCDRTYEIKDCQAPIPLCLNGLTLGLGTDGTVEFWAKDFDQNSQDNCRNCGPSELFFSFSENVGDSSIIFDCNDIGIRNIDLFVTDIAGNQTSCSVNFTVTGVDACSQFTTIEGNINTREGEQVSFVNMQLEDRNTGVSNKMMTSTEGSFAFEAPMARDYMLKPEKNDNIDNGVSIFDLVLLRKHILGHETLNSPYQLIAADINNNGTITTADLVELRKVILHLVDDFPNNTSWRFVENDYVFEYPTTPTRESLSGEFNISNLQQALSYDIVAIKVGDLNGNATIGQLHQSQPRMNEQLVLTAEDQQLKKGEIYDIGQRFEDRGLLTFGWNKKEGDQEPLTYTITVQAQQDGMISQLLNLSSSITPIEAFTTNGDLVNVQLNYQRIGLPVQLLQNTPNPFAQHTVIPFTLSKRDLVKLMVITTSGKVLWEIEQEFDKGYHEIPVNDINTSGVLYYRIRTGAKIASRKMISY